MTNDILSSIQNNIYMPVFFKKKKGEEREVDEITRLYCSILRLLHEFSFLLSFATCSIFHQYDSIFLYANSSFLLSY